MFTVVQKQSLKNVPPRWIFGEYCERRGLTEHLEKLNGVTLDADSFEILASNLGICDRDVFDESELQALYEKLSAILEKKRAELSQKQDDGSLFDEVVNLQYLLTIDLWNAIQQ